MKPNRDMAKVCSGLAGVCNVLAKDKRNDAKMFKRFKQQEKTFRAFAKIYRGEVKSQ